MSEAILSAISQRLGDLADLAFRLKQAVEAGDSAAPFSILRMAVDVDSAATALQGHGARLAPTAPTTKGPI